MKKEMGDEPIISSGFIVMQKSQTGRKLRFRPFYDFARLRNAGR